ncbi:MAG: glycoside hydrolase family 43 protein [Luteolibacter sp.]
MHRKSGGAKGMVSHGSPLARSERTPSREGCFPATPTVTLPSIIARGVLVLMAMACLANALASEKTVAAFDWFEYSGKDPSWESGPGTGKYHNPILAGFYPDPSISRVGDDFYLANSSFAYFPGIPIFHSKDLVNWKLIGHAIHRPEQLNFDGLDVSAGLWAPSIKFHDGKFYMVCTHQYHEENFLVTAENPAGPWSDPVMLGFKGCDPSMFFDDDGRVWVVNSDDPEGKPLYKEHKAVRLQEFDPKLNKMVGPRKVVVNGGVDISKKPRYVEGPHIFKRGGWYYIICAEGGTALGHSEVVFRSRKVDGPYEPWSENPILTQRDIDPGITNAVTCTGHADFVIGPDDNWWVVFLACRPYDRAFTPMGRETFMLPVKWTEDGWPTVLSKGERVPLVCDSPKGASVKPSEAFPLNGSFT